MLRALVLGTVMALVPQATASQAASVLHIKVVLVDADRNLTPVPRHALLISDNPASAPPRLILTAVDGTADVRLRPGNYTIESDRPVTFHGKAYEWRQTVDVVAGRDSILDLTAENAEVSAAASTPAEAAAGGAPPLEADPAFLLPKWQDSVVAVWTPTNRVSGFVVDGMGLVVTNQRVIGADASVEVQLTPTVKVAGTVLIADHAHDTSVIWVDPNTIASVKPVDLGCTEAAKLALSSDEPLFTIGSPLRGPKAMATGVAGRVDAHAILSDTPLAPGTAGGPVFTARGEVVGISSLIDEEKDGGARDSRWNSRIVRAFDACEVIVGARQKMKTASAPTARELPVEPARPFPVDALRAAAKAGTSTITSYQIASSAFDVTFITPVLTYAAQYGSTAPARTTSRDTRKPEPERDLVRPLLDFSNWSDYVSDSPPVVLVRVTPRMVEGFWTMVARGAARTQGMSIPPIKRIKSGFDRMRAFCGDNEVTPIHPFKLEQRFPGSDDPIYEGLYVFDPGALRPECGTVKLVLYSEKEPDKADTKVVDQAVLQRVWQDFEPYRESIRSK